MIWGGKLAMLGFTFRTDVGGLWSPPVAILSIWALKQGFWVSGLKCYQGFA